MHNEKNWAGNYVYNAAETYIPDRVDQVQEFVATRSRVKALGTRHSFNAVADTTASHISLRKLNRVIELDRTRHRVTVEAGIRYGELCGYLHANGYALHNLASLPHISVAGACATATHGSGDRNRNLAAAVHSLELVQGDGTTVAFTKEDSERPIEAAAVGLGALGVVVRMTLDVAPSFEMSQEVYENLPLTMLKDDFDAIFSSAYSVSLFTDWKRPSFNQVWLKHKGRAPDDGRVDFYGATRAGAKLHPVPGSGAEHCTEQQGVPGPWHERMPHFRMEFTPSAGEELQSEYFVSRGDAYAALCALEEMKDRIAPLLYISEVRTIAADELWMSPCYRQDSVAIHFTWKPNWDAVRDVLPIVEEKLAPFQARPHWGKLFTMQPGRLQSLYAKLPEFRRLMARCDPEGKFRNDFLDTYVMGK
ncbi:FAD-binding protein [Paenibacillus sp.]|uniref:FAD-binding protein n=1 Tax=Paenibacillus sp. TaxID=58172 RepID=UPI002811568C|nr:FAD-binding protein [Paenibacillus sp.]